MRVCYARRAARPGEIDRGGGPCAMTDPNPALETIEDEVADYRRDGHAVRVEVDHNYAITLVSETEAVVADEYVNHMILIDPDTGEPREADPNNTVLYVFRLELQEGAWKVTDIFRP